MAARSHQPLLEVDLTSGRTQELNLPDEVRDRWVGGTGLGLFLLSQELRHDMVATDPDCPVYILSGPLTGTAVPSSSDCALTTLNPDLEHHVCTPHAHGHFGARIRHGGWDGIVIRGRASEPVYLWVDGPKVELRPAADLWGEDTFETTRRIRALVGEDVSVACIGPAGENLVWGSLVRVDEFSGFNMGGPGVVWGAKNLKAIAVRGDAAAPVQDPERLAQVLAKMEEETLESGASMPAWPFGRRFLEEEPVGFDWGEVADQKAFGLSANLLSGEIGAIPGKNFTDNDMGVRFGQHLGRDMKKWSIEPVASWNCEIACHHRTTCTTGPMSGVTVTGLSAETIEEVGANLGIEDPGTALILSNAVDGYGMKAAGPPRIIAMLMEAFNAGEIGLEETGGIDLTWGNYGGVLDLLEQTARRQGLGALIAQGFKPTAAAFGIEHRAVHMKWNGFQDYEQRAAPLFLFQSQIVSGADTASAIDNQLALAMGVKPELGVHEALDPEDLSYIPEIAFKSARWTMWENCSGHCHTHARTVKEASHVDAVAAVIGENYTYEDALMIGERLLALQRLIQIYLGFSPEEDFVIADRLLEKIPGGRAAGLGMTGDELRRARNEYYRLAELSTETGAPLPEALSRLGLDDLVVGRTGQEHPVSGISAASVVESS